MKKRIVVGVVEILIGIVLIGLNMFKIVPGFDGFIEVWATYMIAYVAPFAGVIAIMAGLWNLGLKEKIEDFVDKQSYDDYVYEDEELETEDDITIFEDDDEYLEDLYQDYNNENDDDEDSSES